MLVGAVLIHCNSTVKAKAKLRTDRAKLTHNYMPVEWHARIPEETIQDLFPAFADSSGLTRLLTKHAGHRCLGLVDNPHASAVKVLEDLSGGNSLAN